MNTIPSRYQGRLALTYITAPGDTLPEIAKRYTGPDWLALWEVNKGHLRVVSPTHNLLPGEVVLIPFALFSRAVVL